MKNSLVLKRSHGRSVLSVSLKMKHQYTFFMGALKLSCSGISFGISKEFVKTKIDLPVNTRQSAIFGFLNYESNSDIINHLLLIFKYYLFNSRKHKKLSLEMLKKDIVKVYNIEKQICLNDFKKLRKFRKKWKIKGHLLQ